MYSIIVYLNIVVLKIKNIFVTDNLIKLYFTSIFIYKNVYYYFIRHTFKNNIFQVIEPALNYTNKILIIFNK